MTLEATGTNLQQAPSIEAKGEVKILSKEKKVHLLTDKSVDYSFYHKSSSDPWWVSSEDGMDHNEKVEMAHIKTSGKVTIEGAQGVEAEIKQESRRGKGLWGRAISEISSIFNPGSSSSLETNLDTLANNPETSWINEVRSQPNTVWQQIKEEHEHMHEKHESLGPAAMIGVSAVVSFALWWTGVGAGFASSLASSVSGAATQAAAQTAFQAAVYAGVEGGVHAGIYAASSGLVTSAISNKGNFGKVLDDFGSTDNLINIAESVITAGLTKGTLAYFEKAQSLAKVAKTGQSAAQGLKGVETAKVAKDIRPPFDQRVLSHLKTNAVKSFIGAGVSTTFRGGKVGHTLLNAAKQTGIETMANVGAEEIGFHFKTAKDPIHPVTHKFLHGGVGAVTGALMHDDPWKGAASGAIGAIAAEVAADGLYGSGIDKSINR